MSKFDKNKSRVFEKKELTLQEDSEANRLRRWFKKNPKRFAKRCLKVIDRDSIRARHIPLSLNAAQSSLHQLITDIEEFQKERWMVEKAHDDSAEMRPVQVVELKSRKVGVSTYLAFRAFHKGEFEPGTNALIMAHEAPATQNLLKIARRFDDLFTDAETWWRENEMHRSADNLLEWGGAQDSRIVVKTAGTRTSGASRSYTWHFIHISEVAHFSESDEVSAALAAGPNAETHEESTAKGVGGVFYDSWQKSMWLEDARKLFRENRPFPSWWNGKFRWFWSWLQDPAYTRVVLDWEVEQLKSTFSAREDELVADHGATLGQIKWRREKISGECSQQKGMDPEDYFDQEYPTVPEDAFISKGHNVFKQQTLQKMLKASKDIKPVWTGKITVVDIAAKDSLHACVLTDARVNPDVLQFEKPQDGASYIGGVDTAEGLSHGDNSVLRLWNRLDGTRMRLALSVASKHTPEEMGFVVDYFGRMYNTAFIIPEANPPGNATCLKLVRLHYPAIYHRENPERISDHNDPEAFTAGFKTLGNTKALIVAATQEALRNDQVDILDEEGLLEWLHYSNDDGRYTAPAGEKDDRIMADMLAIYAHFKNKAPPVFTKKEVKTDEINWSNDEEDIKKAIKKIIMKARKKNKKEKDRKERSRLLSPPNVLG